MFETHVCVLHVAWLTQTFRPWFCSFQTALSLQFCRSKECKQINMLLKARSSHVSCETSPFRAVANLTKLGGGGGRWHKDFRQLIVFHWLILKSRGIWVSSTHWTGLCILKPETVSPSCRDIIVLMFWRWCVHVLTFGGKKTGGGEARPLPALPRATALSSHQVSFLERSSKSQSFTPSRL